MVYSIQSRTVVQVYPAGMTHFAISLLVFLALAFSVKCIQLGEEEEKALKELVEEFEASPTDGRFDHVICLPNSKAWLIPKVFIWCPIRHFKINVLCPIHKCPLRCGSWTTVLSKESNFNPRCIYDLGGNVLLVQVYYLCPKQLTGTRSNGHRLLSASIDIVETLPASVSRAFPFELHHRSGYSVELMDFVLIGVCQGQSFVEISEAIASMNYRRFVYRNSVGQSEASLEELEDKFYNSILYAFPSNDKLMQLFLSYFEKKRKLYEIAISKITGKVLICDHTLKIGKHVGVLRGEGAASAGKKFENVFIGLNEHGEIMVWSLAKSDSHTEVLDVLAALQERLSHNDVNLEVIIVDDCCLVRSVYEQIFPNAIFRLSISYACQAIVRTLPKGFTNSQQFGKEFSLVFRADGDLGDERQEPTPAAEVIEGNLEQLLIRWSTSLPQATLSAIETLRSHIRIGCLSSVPPVEETEKIRETMQKHLYQSLGGASVLTPELALAVLTCVLGAWNCRKKKLKHFRSMRVTPIIPVEMAEVSYREDLLKETLQKRFSAVANALSSSQGDADAANSGVSAVWNIQTVSSPTELHNDNVVIFVVQRILHIHEFFKSFREQCRNKEFDVSSFPFSPFLVSVMAEQGRDKVVSLTAEEQLTKNSETLKSNLASFGMKLDEVTGDGNCFFRSVATQVEKLEKIPDLSKHLSNINLGKTVEEDTTTLRALFAEELTNNLDRYREWISKDSNIENDIKQFQKDGFFACDLGDLCVKATANVLQVPIVVVTSLTAVPYYPFLPIKFTSCMPIYIAYNHSAPGHYDSTKGLEEEEPVTKPIVRCSCGKNAGRNPSVKYCTESKCACIKADLGCARGCRCRNCGNTKKSVQRFTHKMPEKGCACGSNKKGDPSYLGCSDGGLRKSKCPCLGAGIGCRDSCNCYNCNNKFNEKPKTNPLPHDPSVPKKRRRTSSVAFKRAKGAESVPGSSAVTMAWTELEVICLLVCQEVLQTCGVEQTIAIIGNFYRYVSGAKLVKELCLGIGAKLNSQIVEKLPHLPLGSAEEEQDEATANAAIERLEQAMDVELVEVQTSQDVEGRDAAHNDTLQNGEAMEEPGAQTQGELPETGAAQEDHANLQPAEPLEGTLQAVVTAAELQSGIPTTDAGSGPLQVEFILVQPETLGTKVQDLQNAADAGSAFAVIEVQGNGTSEVTADGVEMRYETVPQEGANHELQTKQRSYYN